MTKVIDGQRCYVWCGFHNVPMSRCDKTESLSCEFMYLGRFATTRLMLKQKEYNIEIDEL